MRPPRAELHLWTVTSWFSRSEPHGHEFSIWVSPLFLETAARIQYDEETCQASARETIRQAEGRVSRGCNYLSFGRWGLETIDLFNNGKCFYLEALSANAFLHGGVWSSHNIDHAHEQSILMAIWLSWAHFVETEVETVSRR